MKNTTCLLAAVLAAAVLLSSGPALGVGADSPPRAAFAADNLGLLSVGAAYEKLDRNVKSGNNVALLETEGGYGWIGLDLFGCLVLKGGIGSSKMKPGPQEAYGDSHSMWMAGATLSVVEHEIVDPAFLASLVSLQLMAGYFEHESEIYGTELPWEETRYAAVVSMESFVEPRDSELAAVPYSAVFYAGPVYSDIEMTPRVPLAWAPAGVPIGEEQSLGALLGLSVKLAPNFSIGYEARLYEEDSHTLSIGFHF